MPSIPLRFSQAPSRRCRPKGDGLPDCSRQAAPGPHLRDHEGYQDRGRETAQWSAGNRSLRAGRPGEVAVSIVVRAKDGTKKK